MTGCGAGIRGKCPSSSGAESAWLGDFTQKSGNWPNVKVVNVSGCPPSAEVMTGVLTDVLTFGQLPELNRAGRLGVTRGFQGALHPRL